MSGNALFHYFRYLLGLDMPHSQTTLLEREAICKYASGALKAVEIGVYEGMNTVNIASAIADKGTLYGIDPFFKGRIGISYGKSITESFLSKKGVRAKVKLIEKLSFDAIDEVPDELDFIFIDGDHSYEGIKRDWADWSAKLKIGGHIALHDTSVPEHDPTVKELGSYQYFHEVVKFSSDFIHLETIDSLNILQRQK